MQYAVAKCAPVTGYSTCTCMQLLNVHTMCTHVQLCRFNISVHSPELGSKLELRGICNSPQGKHLPLWFSNTKKFAHLADLINHLNFSEWPFLFLCRQSWFAHIRVANCPWGPKEQQCASHSIIRSWKYTYFISNSLPQLFKVMKTLYTLSHCIQYSGQFTQGRRGLEAQRPGLASDWPDCGYL